MNNLVSADDEHLDSPVSGLANAKALAKSLDFETVKNGDWFVTLLKQLVRTYDCNAKAAYFQKKYPGLSPDEIADILTSVTVRYATIAGAVAGVAASASEIAALSSAGMTAVSFIGSIGAEMLYLSNIQMRLVLDMATVYDLQLNSEDPEDILMVFGYALGVAPADIIGGGLQVAARAGTTRAIKAAVSKGTLEALQNFGRRVGFKILQRTIIKYAVPVVSAAVGSGYNYVTTQSIGQIAKTHFKHRGKVTDDLRAIVSKQHVFDLAVPAAAMFMARVDGKALVQEEELYRAMLSRMSFEEHAPAEFNELVRNEQCILAAISQIRDAESRAALIEVLSLMAICDGVISDEERDFLTKAADRAGVPFNIEKVAERAKGYQVIAEENVLQKSARAVRVAAASALDSATQVAHDVREAVGRAVTRRNEGKVSDSLSSEKDDPVERLRTVKEMLEAGLITKGEFEAKKAEILSGI
jgi:EcsC protein family/Tellurite resistance protein TerB